jgi:glycosyltransferase involved in cell wall biosynthesis
MLETLARELDVERQVRFMGFVSHAAALMPTHRACLHVAHMENLPLTLIEALSRGLPVFAPAAGGMPEVFNEGVEGRLIPLDDAQAAARLILEWLNDETVMQRVHEAARLRFLERFEADRVALELVGFLDAVVST